MADIKREYVVPLRRGWQGTPRWRRSKKAVYTLQYFIHKHTGAEEVKISNHVNELIWKDGGKNPPGKIKIIVDVKDQVANVELAELSTKTLRAMEKDKKKEEKIKKLKEKKSEAAAPKEEKEESPEEKEKKQKAKITKEQNLAMTKK